MASEETEREDVMDLVHAERELTREEQEKMRAASEGIWDELQRIASAGARRAYSVASPEDFTECVSEHLNDMQEIEMVHADVYGCPVCGRILKDRGTPVAAAVLQERRRLGELLREAESAPADERHTLLARFRRILGIW